jgi:hypothetical protein
VPIVRQLAGQVRDPAASSAVLIMVFLLTVMSGETTVPGL